MKKCYIKDQRRYTPKEEAMNVVTHIFGAMVCLVFSVLMIAKAALGVAEGLYGGGALASVVIFSVALVFMYIMSSVYHGSRYGSRARSVLRRFDHCSISVLIAASYMPYAVIGLIVRGTEQPADAIWGTIIVAVVAVLAVIVIVFNAISVEKFRIFTLISYIIMGWLIIIRIYHFYLAIGLAAFLLLLGGGVAYTAGIGIYKWRSLPYNHAVWHLFVLTGSVMMICGLYFYVL